MKRIIAIITIIVLSFGFSIEGKSDKEHDSKLVGIWKGFEKDNEQKGVEKYWLQERFKDGSYVIMFTAVEHCKVKTFVEKGKWWTKEGKFYEQYENGENIDVYEYKIQENTIANFKSIVLNGENNNTYIFNDYKVEVIKD
jgi:hypothetical protein